MEKRPEYATVAKLEWFVIEIGNKSSQVDTESEN